MSHFDKSLIKILLGKFEPRTEYYTHHFINCCSSFCGSHSKPELRKYLKHLKEKGWIEQHKYPHNIHKWSITTDGLDMRQLLIADSLIH